MDLVMRLHSMPDTSPCASLQRSMVKETLLVLALSPRAKSTPKVPSCFQDGVGTQPHPFYERPGGKKLRNRRQRGVAARQHSTKTAQDCGAQQSSSYYTGEVGQDQATLQRLELG